MSTRKSRRMNSLKISFYVLLEITMYFFSISVILGKIIVAKDDVENFSIKNNAISNPKGKLIFTWKVFTLTNTAIMSKLALLRPCQLSPAAPRWAPGVTSLFHCPNF